MYNLIFNHDPTDYLHYTLQKTFGEGREQSIVNNQKSGKWFDISQYLFYDINETVSTGLRFEWFCDDNGARVFVHDCSGFPISASTSYFAITGGVNWRPLRWVTVRPEVRYDWATNFEAFDNNRDKNQFAITADIIIQF